MDSQASKTNLKRSEDSSRVSTHCAPEASRSSRSSNLSDRVSEYYEKLVRNSHHSKSSSSNQVYPRASNRPQQGFTETKESFDRPITLPRHRDGSPSRSFKATPTYPYTLYVEDPTGAFQCFQKKTSPPVSSLLPSTSQHHSPSVKSDSSNSKNFEPRSKSPLNVKHGGCTQCTLSHSPSSCPMRVRMPAEQDVSASSKIAEGLQTFGSGLEKSLEGSERVQSSQQSGSQKSSVPNISHACERDVIGQERSPVSKSQPITSVVLNTSSSNVDSVPRERKKWVRPPLVGQAASSTDKALLLPSVAFDNPDDGILDSQAKERNLSSSTGSEHTDTVKEAQHQQRSSYFDSSSDGASGVPLSREEYFVSKMKGAGTVLLSQQHTSEGEQGLSDSCGGGRVSPSSSVTSSRRLEWDSGADVGYNQEFGSVGANAESSGLCTIERMALAQGCSVALRLRLDPEGTTVPSTIGPVPVPPTPQQARPIHQAIGKPTAESTPVEKVLNPTSHPQSQKNSLKSGISPIPNSQQQNIEVHNAASNNVPIRELDAGIMQDKCRPDESPIQPVQRQWSNSLQDLRNFFKKCSEGALFKSQSDPDLACDSPTISSKCAQSKNPRGIHRGKNWIESHGAVHSISSGSDATLVHVETEEDLCVPDGRKQTKTQEVSTQPTETQVHVEEKDWIQSSLAQDLSIQQREGNHFDEAGMFKVDNHLNPSNNESKTSNGAKAPSTPPLGVFSQSKISSKKHICSDTDHRRGLHHHFGVLCSTVIGGHISAGPNVGLQPENSNNLPERLHASVDEGMDDVHTIRDDVVLESEAITADSATSSAMHSDAAHEESAVCGNTLTGRANSFEYLPGHVYENNNAAPGCSRHEQPPGISTSTETDSEPIRPISRSINHRPTADSSSHDTEEDRLWASPRVGSNTLVQDLERGLNLLKGVMENKSAGRRCKREVIRRVIRKLVTSDYVEDLIEKERNRHLSHSPFSPRRTKHHDWQERHLRSKRMFNTERQEVSGESDEPKQRSHNQRKKGGSYQVPPTSQLQRTHSTLASGSKSSSLWSSQCDTTSGNISLSGSSDHQKTSKSSMKPNPHYKPATSAAQSTDWMEPATHSEKLFELRKQYPDIPNPIVTPGVNEDLKVREDALKNCFPSDPKQQLCWLTNEINRLRLLKQSLQKKEFGQKTIDPTFLPSAITMMPITSLKNTMKMADCTSPDIPASRSPRVSGQRLQQWGTLESDTSAFCAQSDSSRDSQWQGIEVVSAGEHDNRPHRTVSISEGEENATEAAAPSSNRKSASPASNCSQNIQKARRRSVNINDVGQIIGTHHPPDVPKSRSDRSGEHVDSRTYSSKVTAANAAKPQERVYSSEVGPSGICRSCQNAGHGFSSADSRSTTSRPGEASAQRSAGKAEGTSCSCEPLKEQEVAVTVAKKSAHSTSSPSDSQIAPQSVSRYIQTSEGPLRVHAYVDQGENRLVNSMDSQLASISRQADEVDTNHNPVVRSGSDDSVTKAVTEAVSSKVRALRNLGRIEEAEVKIRVKMGQPSDDVANGFLHAQRVRKSQDLEEERTSFVSKHTEMEEMIARQRALDQETRQKLLAIAESRQRAQSGATDTDHRIQDLLLRDYLNRQQLKSSSADGAIHTRLSVQIPTELQTSPTAEVVAASKKTTGTSPASYSYEKYAQTQELLENSVGSYKSTCVCGSASGKRTVPTQQLQYARTARPKTAPPSCMCSCKSAPQRPLKTLLSSPERQLEFELQIRKQPPRRYDSFDVHEALKGKNKAYFLQFEEDETVPLEESEPSSERPPLEVVTVKVPKQKNSDVQPTVSSSPVASKAPGGRRVPIPSRGEPLSDDRRKYSLYNKENIGGTSQLDPKYRRHLNTVETSQSGNGRKTDDDGLQSFQSDTGSISSKRDKIPSDSRRKSLGSAEITDSPREVGSPLEKSSSDYAQGPSNILRETPGRSHLSVTITDSSMDSVRSPDGNSGSSSSHLPSRKFPTSRSPKRFDSHYRRREVMRETGGKRSCGKVFRTMAFGAETGTSVSLSSSASADHPQRSARAQGDRQPAPDGGSGSEHVNDVKPNSFPSLKEYLEINYPEYLSAAEKRRRCIAEMAYLRRLRQQSRKRLLELEGDSLRAKQRQIRRARCLSRPRPVQRKRTPPKNIRAATAKRCLYLPEVQQRLAELKRKEEHRANRLMAEIYTRKLQEKVLKGSATIRSSVSVISSI